MSEADDPRDAQPDDAGAESSDPGERRRSSRGGRNSADVEIEREHTKRALIEALTRLVTVVLYMAFTLIRERDAGVVALDPSDASEGPEDDWAEA